MAQSKEKLRALRKKYHLGEFRRSSKSIKRTAPSTFMRRKRSSKSRVRRYGSKSAWSEVTGVGLYLGYDILLKPTVMTFVGNPNMLSVGEALAGWYFRKSPGWKGDLAKTALILNLYSLALGFVGGTGISVGSNPY